MTFVSTALAAAALARLSFRERNPLAADHCFLDTLALIGYRDGCERMAVAGWRPVDSLCVKVFME
jgi:hypothetical protein